MADLTGAQKNRDCFTINAPTTTFAGQPPRAKTRAGLCLHMSGGSLWQSAGKWRISAVAVGWVCSALELASRGADAMRRIGPLSQRGRGMRLIILTALRAEGEGIDVVILLTRRICRPASPFFALEAPGCVL